MIEARSRVYSTQLTVSIWCYCFRGEADCKEHSAAGSRVLAVRCFHVYHQLITAIMHAVFVFVYQSSDLQLPSRYGPYLQSAFPLLLLIFHPVFSPPWILHCQSSANQTKMF